MNRSTMLFLLGALGGTAEARAQEPVRVTLDEALRRFAAGNSELQLARARAAEAAGLNRQAGAFPNPAVAASHEPLSAAGRSYTESYLNLTQRVELPGRRSARTDAAAHAHVAALARLRADSLRLGFELKRSWTETALGEELRSITEGAAGVFRRAATQASQRFAEGDVSRFDVRRIDVERARYENLAADARLQAGASQRALASMMGSDGAAIPVGSMATHPPRLPPGLLETASAARRPELAAALAELEAARAETRLTRAERIPDLTATAGLKRQSDGLEGAFFGLSVPVPLFDRRGGAVTASDARVRAAEERLALTRRQLENDVVRAVDAYASLVARAELLGAAGSEASDLLQIAEVAYDAGEIELVALLDAADAHQQARTAEARLRAQLWIAHYDLERALGGFDASAAPARENDR